MTTEMYFLDTDILSLLLRDHSRVLAQLNSTDQSAVIATSIVSRIEVLRGRFDTVIKASNKQEWLRAQYWLRETETRLAKMQIVPIDEAVADHFQALRTTKKAHKIGRADLLIACIALANKATLVTRNTKDFKLVSGLKLENWAD